LIGDIIFERTKLLEKVLWTWATGFSILLDAFETAAPPEIMNILDEFGAILWFTDVCAYEIP